MTRPQMDDYIDVAERLQEFRAKYPEGTLQQADVKFIDFAGNSWVVYTAAAYRVPDDPRPAHGTAWEPVPGRTPFTRDSELQNAETAAWGRAIVAVGAADTKRGGIASKQEVRNRQVAQQPPPQAEPLGPPGEPDLPKWGSHAPMTPKTRGRMFALFGELKIDDEDEQRRGISHVIGREVTSRADLTDAEAKQVIAVLEARKNTAVKA